MQDLIVSFFTESSQSTLLNPKRSMNISLVVQLVISACFCFTAIFLRHFSNVGFQLLITGITNIVFALGAFWIINKQPDSLSVGACLGSGVVMSILSLITAVYWGELSRCEEVEVEIKKYTCNSKGAMRFLCLFSVCLFVLQVFFTSYLAQYKSHVLAASLQYSELPGADESDHKESESSLYAPNPMPKTWASNLKKEGAERERDSLIV